MESVHVYLDSWIVKRMWYAGDLQGGAELYDPESKQAISERKREMLLGSEMTRYFRLTIPLDCGSILVCPARR